MSWRQVLVTLLCSSLTVQSSPCSWVEVLSTWSQGYKAVVKLQTNETVDHWDIDVEFSEPAINFEAWKGHVNKISDTSYTVSNTCYNNMVYSCQCFELPYLVRHEPLWEGNTTFNFNGELVPTCEPPSCDDSLSGVANTTSSTQPAESLTTSELTENLNVVGNILNDLSSLRLKRYNRQSNGFTKDENELLNTLAEYTTYLKNECSTKSGSCQSKTLAAYGSKLNSIFQKVKNSGGISSGFVDAFKGKYEELKEATKTAVDKQAENSCKANGKPCIFPFKDDAGKEHNTCADYKGRYFWCATRVNSKGKYVSWEKCPDDGSCPPPKKTTTTTTTTTTPPPPPTKQPQQGVACMAGSKPCVFPFKDTDGTEYNECADYKGRYFWCATAVNSKGTFTNWGKCTECEDSNTTPSTPEDCSCTDYINKKGYGDCQKGHPDFSNAEICYVKLPSTCSDLRESKTDPGKMASAEACKKVDGDDSCCQELDIASTGVAREHQGARLGSYKKQTEENDGKPVYLQEGSGGNYLFYKETFGWLISRQGPQSTSKGGIMSDSAADCPTDGGMKWKIYDRVTYDNIDSTFKLTCKGSDTTLSNHRTKPPGSCLANGKPCIFPFKDDDGTSYNGCPKYEGRYYWCATSLKTNGVYKVWEHCPEDGSCPLLPNDDDSSTPAALPKPTIKPSESPDCRVATKDDCPTEHTFMEGGFKIIPYDDIDDSKHDVGTKCDCRQLCDDRSDKCKAFLFKTCSNGPEPRCILLNAVEPTTNTIGQYNNQLAFCRRDSLSRKRMPCRVGPKRDCTPDAQNTLPSECKCFNSPIKCFITYWCVQTGLTSGICVPHQETGKCREDGITIIKSGKCVCGRLTRLCTTDEYCYVKDSLSSCQKKPPCENTDGTIIAGGNGCMCRYGSIEFSCGSNEYCDINNNVPRCSTLPSCVIDNKNDGAGQCKCGHGPNTVDCDVSYICKKFEKDKKFYCGQDMEYSLTTKKIHDANWMAIRAFGEFCRNLHNKNVDANTALTPLEKSNEKVGHHAQYGFLVAADKNEMSSLDWILDFDPEKGTKTSCDNNFAKPDTDKNKHSEEFLFEKMTSPYKHTYFLFTVNSPCAGNPDYHHPENTCVYKTMKKANELAKVGSIELRVGFMQWWVREALPGKATDDQCKAARENFCERVEFYRTYGRLEYTPNLQYILFEANCKGDNEWSPDITC